MTYVFSDLAPNDPFFMTFPIAEPQVSGMADVAAQASASSLPFNYKIALKCCLNSRHFRTSTGKICVSLAANNFYDGATDNALYVSLRQYTSTSDRQVGSTVSWYVDGQYYYSCWGPGLDTSKGYYIRFDKRDDGDHMDGDGQVWEA